MTNFSKCVLWTTAGHIDHGKTALLKALTGMDADRLPEEKARGITIDIGFAHLATDDMELSFVDVPGHEAFVKNMLAGAGGARALLLAVAANESIKPQTEEHFQIASLLGISVGVIVITKKDLADESALKAVKNEMKEFTKGTFLENAPVFCADALSGDGVAELKSALIDISKKITQKEAGKIFRLSADRSFTIKGFGTIVTGTVIGGSVREGDTLILLPKGRNVRVRGIEVHGKKTKHSRAGWRTALNLQSVNPKEISRGDTLVNSQLVKPTRFLDALIKLLPSAPQLKQHSSLHFHHAANDVLCRTHIFNYETPRHENEFFARIALEKEAVVFSGERFILRQFSRPFTIGGGVVLDNAPPKKKPSFDAETFEEIFENAEDAAPLEIPAPDTKNLIRFFVRRAPFGVSFSEIAQRIGLTADEFSDFFSDLKNTIVIKTGDGYALTEEKYNLFSKQLKETLEEFHRAYPLRQGMEWQVLRKKLSLKISPKFFDVLLKEESVKGKIIREGEFVSLSDFKPASGDANIVGIVEEKFLKAKLQPPPPATILAELGAQGREAFQYLLRSGRILKIESEYVVHGDCLNEFLSRLKKLALKKERFDISDVKTLTGLSRKYVIPLLEYLDRAGITSREGNFRRIK